MFATVIDFMWVDNGQDFYFEMEKNKGPIILVIETMFSIYGKYNIYIKCHTW